ncbi:MAG: hypothetical protein JWQ15_271, partial [Marmoricola sp.]|nr:hypothetical protein [Marmoricola sp.]
MIEAVMAASADPSRIDAAFG